MNSDQLAVLMASTTAEWGTPLRLFEQLNAVKPFTLDVCCTHENALCGEHYTKAENSFTQPWFGHWWCNPVYGNPELPCKRKCRKKRCVAPRGKSRDLPPRGHVIEYQPGCIDFVRYGINQVKLHGSSGIYLVPARTDTVWFEELWAASHTVLFIKRRLSFLYEGKELDPAPFPSALFEVAPNPPNRPVVDLWDLS